MTTSPPLVSVLMTCFNREQYVADAIKSVLASTYSHLELIIVDDCSTDNTVEIIKKFEVFDARVKVFVNEQNLTDYPNRNKAASYAKGKYLKYVDSDDFLYPHGLAILVSRMEANPEATVGLAKRSFKDKPFPILLSPNECYKLHFIDHFGIFNNAPTSSIIRRDFFLSIGCFSGLNQYGDYEFWLKAGAINPILMIEGDVTWDRDHPLSEKHKDDNYFKAQLHYTISIKALKSTQNPMPAAEKELALKILKHSYSKLIVRTVIKGKLLNAVSLLKVIQNQ